MSCTMTSRKISLWRTSIIVSFESVFNLRRILVQTNALTNDSEPSGVYGGLSRKKGPPAGRGDPCTRVIALGLATSGGLG